MKTIGRLVIGFGMGAVSLGTWMLLKDHAFRKLIGDRRAALARQAQLNG